MSGETNLSLLLSSMSPHLNDGDYVFCTLTPGAALDFSEVIVAREDALRQSAAPCSSGR